MAIYAPTGGGKDGAGGRGPFILCPSGLQKAVCCDIINHGKVMTSYPGAEPKLVHKITIRWQSEHLMKDGRPFLVQKRYTLSLHPQATLRKDLEAWRGRVFTDIELKGEPSTQTPPFDIERVLNANAFLNIMHKRKGARGDFAEVIAIAKCAPTQATLKVRDYVRVKDRKEEDQTADHREAREPGADDDPGDGAAPDEVSDPPPF